MKFALSMVLLVLLALIVPFLVPFGDQSAGVDHQVNLPWQIAIEADGQSQVFGIRPGRTTLREAMAALPGDPEVAIVAAPDEPGALEAYYGQISLGFVMARVILVVDASEEQILAMRERAPKAEYMESTTRKILLHPEDRARVAEFPVKALSVIPTVNLDETTVIQRFGPPGERLQVSAQRVHLLYPDKGLDVIVDGEGKELLQYVAPRDFAMLRDPLLQQLVGK